MQVDEIEGVRLGGEAQVKREEVIRWGGEAGVKRAEVVRLGGEAEVEVDLVLAQMATDRKSHSRTL